MCPMRRLLLALPTLLLLAVSLDARAQWGEGHNVFIPRLYQAAPLTDYPVGLSAMGSETQVAPGDWIVDGSGVLTMRHPWSYTRSTQLLFYHNGDVLLRKPLSGSDPAWGDWQQVLVERGGLVRTRDRRLGLDGQLGIGLAAGSIPTGYTLAVKGRALAEEVVVEPQAAWPDYVFEADYELMPLAALGAFVRERGHLPGVPTAEEVAAEGVRLGEMQAALLEKVEELTLYVLEQDERLAKLARANAQLLRRIEALGDEPAR